MIVKLGLENFGKFKLASFDFARVTSFVGDNESGKSTIFDALVDALCEPPGSSVAGKAIRARYGEERKATLEFSGPRESIDQGEFLELFAIGSGEISLELKDGSAWLDQVKANLFSGGIDPRLLAKELEGYVTPRANAPFVKKLKAQEEELAEAKAELASMLSERERILGQEVSVREGTTRVEELDKSISALEAKKKKLAEELAQQRLARELKAGREGLARIERAEALSRELKASASFAKDEGQSLARLREARDKGANEASLGETYLRDSRERAARARQAIASFDAESDSARRLAELAQSLLSKIEAAKPGQKTHKKTEFRIPVIVAGAIFALIGVGCAIALSPPISLILFAAGCILAVASVIASVKRVELRDDSELVAALADAKREWASRSGKGAPALEADSLTRLIAELSRIAQGREEADRRLAELRAVTREAEANVEAALARAEEAKAKRDRDRDALSSWLLERGASSPEEYAERRAGRTQAEASFREAEAALRDAATRVGLDIAGKSTGDWVAALAANYKLAIQRAEAELHSSEASEQALRAMENEARIIERELDQARRNREGIGSKVSEERGRVSGSLGGLPARIAELERDIGHMASRLDELRRDRRAAEIATKLLDSIQGDSQGTIESLAQEISSTYSSLLSEERGIALKAFSVDKAQVVDSGGTPRSMERLSQGTRDAFLLAARLTLAKRRAGGAPRPLVFDDAFIAFDEGRARGALQLLSDFAKTGDWQFVFFTKDRWFAKLVEEFFPDCKKQALSRAKNERGL